MEELERERHRMNLVNRYLAAGRPQLLKDLGFSPAEIRGLTQAGGYSADDLTRMRDTLRYYKTKSKRRLWLPDKGDQ